MFQNKVNKKTNLENIRQINQIIFFNENFHSNQIFYAKLRSHFKLS